LWQPGRVWVDLRRAATQNINNATITSIDWDTEDSDTDEFITATSTTLTVPPGLGGLYVIGVTGSLSALTTGRSFVQIIAGGKTIRSVYTGDDTMGVVTPPWPLSDGNTIIAQVFQNSAGARNFTGDLWATRLSI
jgi:hypothetical protein